jgi:hypothetical protein
MRHEDYEHLKEIAAELFVAETDEMRLVIGKRLEAEFARIDAVVSARNWVRPNGDSSEAQVVCHVDR